VDSALVSTLVNLGAGFIVVILVIFGYLVPKPEFRRLLEENEKLREALDLERQRSNEIAQAGAVANQLIAALTSLASDRRAEIARTPDPSGKDTSL
jgi:hypothetical protein